ncbi:MAG: hypothetical protein KJ767_00590 [Nanoarchaeota archaeon]|nr:hypothetical protein [Nanoarchaeota archaeon]
MEKKGISPIIATVLIIAITIGAGVLLYSMVQPLIQSNMGKAECTQTTFELDRFSSCAGSGIIKVSIDRTVSTSDEPDVIGWKIVAVSEGEKMTLSADDWDDIVPGIQKTKQLSFSEFPVTNIEVYPVIKSNNIVQECTNIKRQIKVSPC